ncbi:acyltransferase [Gluconacetobacter azotocaptans]|uniref:Acyltransferase n=1 Tax=Gluconacetobacter azotocaptans TaxID=142834 RepID=A0A7W4JQS3_9PROT|nr:acyltransferase [Gluconacetobacter azotocaptans]MBB2189005.1 acyltransferase [Gluconacetobacter azotocaptans]GBQ27617.1 acyltransferase [Gluconacetobacter azotocaptans DSM 13594]
MLERYMAPPAKTSWTQLLQREFFPTDRRRDIDGLRGLAVLMVVLFHAGWLRGGFVGVDIFVVISGYFMGRSALMQHPFKPVNFVCRRLYRLLPALLCMIALVSAGMLWWLLPSDRADVALNGAYALVYLSNIWASGHVGYFEGQSIAYPFLHTWSLSLEMQFYTIIFMMALFLPFLRHRKWAISAICLLSFAFSMVSHLHGDTQGYYNIFDRMWQFSLGTMIWILPPLRLSRGAATLVFAAAYAMLIGAALFYRLDFACPSYMSALPCLAVVALIMLPQTGAARIGLVPLSPVGVISYSIYLWHWPGIVVANYLMAFQVHGWTMAAVLGIVMVVSLFSYLFVERVGLEYEKTARQDVRVRGAGFLVGACTILALVLFSVSATYRVH